MIKVSDLHKILDLSNVTIKWIRPIQQAQGSPSSSTNQGIRNAI